MYGIQRVEKYKKADVAGLQKEANRELKQGKYINDVDLEQSSNNMWLVRSGNWLKKIETELAIAGIKKPRKDAVLMIGSFYGASPDFFENKTKEEIKQYFKDCLAWHIKTYCGGNADLVINAVIHMDETTPHMQISSIPICNVKKTHTELDPQTGKKVKITDGYQMGLSAKEILGNVKAYTDRVDSFYMDVSRKYGLERGEHKTDTIEQVKHKTALQHKVEKLEDEISYLKNDIQDAIENQPWYISALEETSQENEQYKQFISSSADIENRYYDFIDQQTIMGQLGALESNLNIDNIEI